MLDGLGGLFKALFEKDYAVVLQNELVGELLGADVLLVGAPLYNYSVPSSLKTWIDHVHIPGRATPFVDAPTADGGTARRGRL